MNHALQPRIGRVLLEPVSIRQGKRIVHTDDIPIGDGLTIQRGSLDTLNELSFILVGDAGREIQVRCQW